MREGASDGARGRDAGNPGRALTRRCVAAGLAAAAIAWGCGSSEQPKPSGPSMAQAPAQARATNGAPVVGDVRLDPTRPRPGHRIRALVQASDPDGDPVELSYHWTAGGRALPEATAEATVPELPKGTRIEVAVVASDGRAESPARIGAGQVGNLPPELVAIRLEPPGEVNVGVAVVAVPQAQDPDGDEMRFEYAWSVNGESAGDDTPSFDTTKLHRGDTVQVRVVANDGEEDGNAIESPPLRVGNAAPKITSSPGGFERDGSFRYTVTASDPDGDRTLRFRLVKGPEGMTVDSLTGEMQWKPTAAQAGKHEVEVAAEDLQGGSGTQRFELRVGTDAAPAAAAPAPVAKSEEQAPTGREERRASSRAPTPRSATTPVVEEGEDGEATAAAPAAPPARRRRGAPPPPASAEAPPAAAEE